MTKILMWLAAGAGVLWLIARKPGTVSPGSLGARAPVFPRSWMLRCLDLSTGRAVMRLVDPVPDRLASALRSISMLGEIRQVLSVGPVSARGNAAKIARIREYGLGVAKGLGIRDRSAVVASVSPEAGAVLPDIVVTVTVEPAPVEVEPLAPFPGYAPDIDAPEVPAPGTPPAPVPPRDDPSGAGAPGVPGAPPLPPLPDLPEPLTWAPGTKVYRKKAEW
ncbi:MAG: hypothetical protein ABID40_01715 [Candidatus Bipolaricaulota bacterium]